MKYFITAVALVLSIQSFGQFVKGDKALSGSFGLTTRGGPNYSNTIQKYLAFNIGPSFGVFVSPVLEVGGQLSYSTLAYSSQSDAARSEYKGATTSTGLYAQRYFKLADEFMFTLVGGANYTNSTGGNKTTDAAGNVVSEDKTKYSGAGISIQPGFIFLPSTHWALQVHIGYANYSLNKNKMNDTKSNSLSIDYGQVYLGVVYYFRSSQ